jgi:lysophospholipase L1-like esterase
MTMSVSTAVELQGLKRYAKLGVLLATMTIAIATVAGCAATHVDAVNPLHPNVAQIDTGDVNANVVFMGDSVTYNWAQVWAGTTFTSHSNWVDVGISGQTSGQMEVRFDTDVVAKHPLIVVILAGTNDVYPGWVLCGGNWWADTCHNIAYMALKAKAAGITPILATIPPWNCIDSDGHCDLATNADNSPGRYGYIDQLNAWIKSYGASQGLIVVDYHSVLMAEDGKHYQPQLTIDGVHPMPAGYALMAPMIEDAIRADSLK